MKKRGLSGVVTAVILIALAIALVGIVWTVVNNLVTDELDEAGSCFGIFDKVTINNRYTCYNSSSEQLQFSISVGDIEIEELLVGVSASGSSGSFRITNIAGTVPNVMMYPGGSTSVFLPGENAGLTYLFNMSAAGLFGAPDNLQIAPVVNGNQCEVTDSLNEFDPCSLIQ